MGVSGQMEVSCLFAPPHLRPLSFCHHLTPLSSSPHLSHSQPQLSIHVIVILIFVAAIAIFEKVKVE